MSEDLLARWLAGENRLKIVIAIDELDHHMLRYYLKSRLRGEQVTPFLERLLTSAWLEARDEPLSLGECYPKLYFRVINNGAICDQLAQQFALDEFIEWPSHLWLKGPIILAFVTLGHVRLVNLIGQ